MAIAVKASKVNGCVLPVHPLYAEGLDVAEFEHADSPIVKAAYDIARKIHDGHPRNEKRAIDKPFAYITHPVMVCKLLKLMQHALPEKYADRKALDDEMYLAVALLHDVLEEKGTRYYHKPDDLCRDLCRGIIRHVIEVQLDSEAQLKGLPASSITIEAVDAACDAYPQKKHAEIMAIAEAITGDCQALCNPEKHDMLEGKRAYQVEHMQTLADRPKLIKMLDQMASAIEDTLFESQRSPQQIHEFFHKALDVVKAGGASGLDEHKLAEQMFLKIFEHYSKIQQMYDAGQEADPALRLQFSIHNVVLESLRERADSLQAKAHLYAAHAIAPTRPHTPYVTVSHPSFSPSPPRALINRAPNGNECPLPDFGCVNVKLRLKDGLVHVVGYSVRVPQDHSSTLNLMLSRKAQTYLTGSFEIKESGKRVSVGDLRPHDGDFVRDFWLEKPVQVDDFLATVRSAGTSLKSDLEHMLHDGARTELSGDQAAMLDNLSKRMNPLMDYAMLLELKKNAMKMQLEYTGTVGLARN